MSSPVQPKPTNPDRRLCPICWRQFPDLWVYKNHQDDCIAADRAKRKRAAA